MLFKAISDVRPSLRRLSNHFVRCTKGISLNPNFTPIGKQSGQFLSAFGATAPTAPGPPHSRGFLITHTTTHHSRQDSSGGVISSSQRPLPDNTQHLQTYKLPVGFEPTYSAGKRPQTLHRAAISTGNVISMNAKSFGILSKVTAVAARFSGSTRSLNSF